MLIIVLILSDSQPSGHGKMKSMSLLDTEN